MSSPGNEESPDLVKVPPNNPMVTLLYGVGCLGGLCLVGAVLAMIFPAFAGREREELNTQVCSNHLRELAKGALLYAGDHSETLPASVWDKHLIPYAGSDRVMYSCPVQRRLNPQTSGYAISEQAAGKKLSSFTDQTKTVLFFDATSTAFGAVAKTSEVPRPARHEHGRVNVFSYLDGHVRRVELGAQP